MCAKWFATRDFEKMDLHFAMKVDVVVRSVGGGDSIKTLVV